MNRFETRLDNVEEVLSKRQETTAQGQEAMVQRIKKTSTNRPILVSGQHSHPVDLSIPLPTGFTAHRNGQDDIDYWMVPQVGEFAVRVHPYGASALGVLVHGMDDGKDYIVTEQGGWTEIPPDHYQK